LDLKTPDPFYVVWQVAQPLVCALSQPVVTDGAVEVQAVQQNDDAQLLTATSQYYPPQVSKSSEVLFKEAKTIDTDNLWNSSAAEQQEFGKISMLKNLCSKSRRGTCMSAR
jgi:hypothetical protein